MGHYDIEDSIERLRHLDALRIRNKTMPECLSGRQDSPCKRAEKSHLGSNPSSGSTCLTCYKTLRKNRKSRQQKLYCSVKCQREQEYQAYILAWLRGEENGMRGQTQVSNHIRRWLFERRGETCWECSWKKKHPISGKCPLEIDHIDGCHTNNSPNNLRLLCPNCHSLTPTYKNRNKGHGRPYRRERYAEGKSF